MLPVAIVIHNIHMQLIKIMATKDALIHHLAHWILVYQLVSCYIGIGKLLTDITDIR